MPLYVFDLGNSSTGAIGYVARIRAKTKKDAVKRLKEMLPEAWEIELPENMKPGESLVVYFNDSDYPKLQDITGIEEP